MVIAGYLKLAGRERASSMQRAAHDNTVQSAGLSTDAEDESFTACLNRHLRRSELSLTALARRSWLDISYVSRLVHLPCDPLNPRYDDRGEKRRPSRDTVIRLGLAMQLPIEDLDELLLAAGYAPLVR
jgi:hypothetical protein